MKNKLNLTNMYKLYIVIILSTTLININLCSKTNNNKINKYPKQENNEEKDNKYKVYFSMQNAIIQPNKVFNLNISRTHLNKINDNIDKLKNLISLDARMNNIKSINPNIYNCSKLETIILDDNKFRQLPKELLNMKNIKLISLISNYITKINIQKQNSLPKLQELNLSFNQIQSFNSIPLQKLKRLDLWNNNITNIKLNTPNLEKLYLGNNKLNAIPKQITNLNKLKILNVSYNNIKQINNIHKLQNLTTLEAIKCNLNKIPKQIHKLKKLQKLDLSNNNITNIKPLNKLDQIKYIIITNNPIKKDDIKKLKTTLPNTIITH